MPIDSVARLKHRVRVAICLIPFLCGLTLADAIQVSHGYTPFGTLKYPADFSHFDYVNPDAPKGGQLKLYGHGTFDSLNPYILKGRSIADTPGMFMFGFLELTDTLLAGSSPHNRAGDEPASAYGLIASTLEYPASLDWVIFTLRKEARFQDGHPITAEDVAFSFNLLKQHGHPRYAIQLANVSAVQVLDTQRVKFFFEGQYKRDLPLVVGALPILPEHFWKDHSFDETRLEPMLISGPYRVTSVKAGKQIRFERDRDYWAKDLPVNKGRYNFDEVIIDYYRDADVAFEAFKAGHYHIHYDYIAKHWANAYSFPALQAGDVIKQEIPHRIAQGTQGFFINTRKPKFQDVRVRQALNLLFDFEWTNQHIFNNAYQRSESWFPNSRHALSGTPDAAVLEQLAPFKSTLPHGLFKQPFAVSRSDGSGRIRQQLQQAMSLFRQAGYDIQSGRLTHTASGEPFTLEILNYHSASMDRVVQPYLKNLRQAGIEASFRMVDPAQYKERLDQFDFDITIYVLPQRNIAGPELMEYFHSTAADTPGSLNLSGIQHPAIDALVEQALTAREERAYLNAMRALDSALLWHYYIVPHWHLSYHRLAWWNRFEQPATPAVYTLGIENWWQKNNLPNP